MSTEFGPGKYRMANGEQAIVVCDVGENPIGDNHEPYPLKGYAKHGPMSWTREGKRYNFCDDGFDLKEPWTDPPTTLEALIALRDLWTCPVESYHPAAAKALRDADARIAAEKARTA